MTAMNVCEAHVLFQNIDSSDQKVSDFSSIQSEILKSECVSMSDLTEQQQMATITTNQQLILPFLHLGDYEAFKQIGAGNPEQFSVVIKVTHQVHDDPHNKFYYNLLPSSISLYDIGKDLHDVDDSWCQLSNELDRILPKIEKHLQAKERVLVNCTQGVSRSATVVIAYLMWQYQVPYDKAFAFVQSKRLQISPIDAFVKGLKSKYTQYGGR